MQVAEKIKKLRTSRGLTQGKLADKILTTQKTVSNWESGVSEPNLFNSILLADVFNISLDELACRDFKGGQAS